jgi:nitroreductase
MSVSEIIRTKRDIREFSSQPVSKEDKLAILEAARMAGSGLNSQHWRFILIDDKSELEALARLSTTGEWVAGANFAVIILTEKNRPYHALDAGRALTNMQLEAWSRGIASCIYTGFKEAEMRKRYGIPEKYSIDVVVGFGYPARKIVGKKNRKPLEEIAYSNKFGQPLNIK